MNTPLSQLSAEEREARHDDYIDHRTCEVASILIQKRGREPKRAYKIAARFAAVEFNKLIRWG